jgi:anti-sigma factor RsiW
VSIEPPPKSPNQLEQLVAYLDGELNDQQSAAMEKRLRDDPKLRRMADDLDRTWGLLDALEPVVAGEEFSQRTMKTVATSYSHAEQQRPASLQRLLSTFASSQALTWFGIGVLGTLCGLGLSAFRSPSEESAQATQLLRQIDILDRYPRYSIIPDVASLQQLRLPADGTETSQEAP